MRVRIAVVFLLLLISVAVATAADYSGKYTLKDASGVIVLELQQEGIDVTGSFTRGGKTLILEGGIENGIVMGVMHDENEFDSFIYFTARRNGASLSLAFFAGSDEEEPDLSNPMEQLTLSAGTSASMAPPVTQPRDEPRQPASEASPAPTPPPAGDTTPSAKGGSERTIKVGETYNAGDRLQSTFSGIAFTVPKSFAGGYDGDSGAVMLRAQDGSMVLALYGYSVANPSDIINHVGSELEKQGAQLVPEGSAQLDERTIEAASQIYSNEITGRIYALVRGSDRGNALGVFAIGNLDRARLEKPARELLETVAWSEPEAKQWRQRLAGRSFSTTGSGSMYSPGGAGGGGSFASQSKSALDLCSDGSYYYESESQAMASIEGLSAESNSSDSHSGRWWIVSDLAGAAILSLSASDGRWFTWAFIERQQDVAIDGKSYGAGPGQRCQ